MNRPPPPSDVALQLRQEAGFGCCRCGHPIFVYHHIVPWSGEHHFRPADMMVLCPNCHDKMRVTSREEQYAIKRNPYNVVHHYPNGQLCSKFRTMQLCIGNTLFINCPNIIRFAGENLLSLRSMQDGKVAISARLYDEKDRLIAVIENNFWEDRRKLAWDIIHDYQYLKIRQGYRKILLEIDMRQEIVDISCNIWRNGYAIIGRPRSLLIKRKDLVKLVHADSNRLRGLHNGFNLISRRRQVTDDEERSFFKYYLD